MLPRRCLGAIWGICALGPMLAAGANPTAELRVSSETVPPGGTAQIKIFLSAPLAISDVRMEMDFDPVVFGEVASVFAFGSTGDTYGLAEVRKGHLRASIGSPSGGIGQLPDVPILEISIPVLASAPPGRQAVVTISATGPFVRNSQGQIYSVTVTPGLVTVGGALSIQSVSPGGGVLPAGALVRIDGTEFTPVTTLEVDGVSVGSVAYAGPTQINFTLNAPAEFAGKRVRLRNPDGSQVDYFSDLRTRAADQSSSIHPFVPLQAWSNYGAFISEFATGGIVLVNPNPFPVEVKTVVARLVGPPSPGPIIQLPASGVYRDDRFFTAGIGTARLYASAPIRMVGFQQQGGTVSVAPTYRVAYPTRDIRFDYFSPPTFEWQIGAATPMAWILYLKYTSDDAKAVYGALDYSVSSTPFSGDPWLKAVRVPGPAIQVSVEPSSLGPGVYTGIVTVKSAGAADITANVSLTVAGTPFVSDLQKTLGFSIMTGQTAALTNTLAIGSSGAPIQFTATAGTDNGAPWLSVNPTRGTTPSTLTVSVDPAHLTGDGPFHGVIGIAGPSNTRTVDVSVGRFSLITSPTSSLQFSVPVGALPLPATLVQVYPYAFTFTASAAPFSGGNWLSVAKAPDPAPSSDWLVRANTAGLPVGDYQGILTFKSPPYPDVLQIPAGLRVWNGKQPALTVTPSSLEFAFDETEGAVFFLVKKPTLSIATGGLPLEVTVTADGCATATPSDLVTPATVAVQSGCSNSPGVHRGSITVRAPSGDGPDQVVVVPFTYTVAPAGRPLIASLVNAASEAQGAVAPGEIITIRGYAVGSLDAIGLMLDKDGRAGTNQNGARVLFDGVPAPLLYGSPSQVNAIVPYEVAGHGVTTVEVELNGVRSLPWGMPVAGSAPGIFTIDGSGRGRAAVLNQDNTLNLPSNPADRGTVVQIFAAGEGLTEPPGVTGSITGGDLKRPALAVSATIGGVDAKVLYAGSSPGSVAGLLQVNVVVPSEGTPDPATQIVLTIGSARSPEKVTIAVR